jgi:hypothetical protein
MTHVYVVTEVYDGGHGVSVIATKDAALAHAQKVRNEYGTDQEWVKRDAEHEWVSEDAVVRITHLPILGKV